MGLFDFFSPKRNEPFRLGAVNPSSTANRELRPLKVTETKEIENYLKVVNIIQENEMTFYCPIRNAKIYCHSVLVDKLGDLTKFIISSIHKGHTIEEICALTQMGNTTIKEELDYLIRGGLIEDDKQTLTDLGNQYGVLLERFSELSEGIDISFNTFANKFEEIEDDKLVSSAERKYILENQYIPVLTRNDNYANSLEIAMTKIEPEMPFCREIKNSLYVTVEIERKESKYRPVYVRDFSRGYSSESDSCVKIAIPCDMVRFKLRYKSLDKYRDVIPTISSIDGKFDELLSNKAKDLLNKVKEEDETEIVTAYFNTITGEIIRAWDDLCEDPNDSSVYVLEPHPMQLGLDENRCKDIYLQEVNREHLYQVRYFPYSRMEV